MFSLNKILKIKFFLLSFVICNVIFDYPGINRFFHMACIHKNFLAASGKTDVTSVDIWRHLSAMYNLETLVPVFFFLSLFVFILVVFCLFSSLWSRP